MTQSSYPAFRSGGFHEGRFPVCIWQVVSVHTDSTKNTFDYLNHMGHCPHFVWNPYTGEIIECLPLDQAGCLFTGQINRCGKPAIQTAVVGTREEPFTDSPLKGAEILFRALKDQGVPPLWPKGPPSLTDDSRAVYRGITEAGHYSVSQLHPGFLGIGSIDIRKLTYD